MVDVRAFPHTPARSMCVGALRVIRHLAVYLYLLLTTLMCVCVCVAVERNGWE